LWQCFFSYAQIFVTFKRSTKTVRYPEKPACLLIQITRTVQKTTPNAFASGNQQTVAGENELAEYVMQLLMENIFCKIVQSLLSKNQILAR